MGPNHTGATSDDAPCFSTAVPPGLPDDAFATTGGQITKREVRLLSLAELALRAGDVLWDIGAGSGAVSIEAGRSQPASQVHAVERRTEFCAHFNENLRRFPAPNVKLTRGNAPEVCSAWPDPNAVFIGGSGGYLSTILDTVRSRLRPGGRLVMNFATVDNLHIAIQALPGARVTQIQVSRGVPVQSMLRLQALNPVFLVTWRKGI